MSSHVLCLERLGENYSIFLTLKIGPKNFIPRCCCCYRFFGDIPIPSLSPPDDDDDDDLSTQGVCWFFTFRKNNLALLRKRGKEWASRILSLSPSVLLCLICLMIIIWWWSLSLVVSWARPWELSLAPWAFENTKAYFIEHSSTIKGLNCQRDSLTEGE